MGQLFIPALGTELELAEDWEFTLYNEYRNGTLAQVLGIQWQNNQYFMKVPESVPVTMPAGTILKLSRLYIRAGQGAFDSATFSVTAPRAKKIQWPQNQTVYAGGFRFWAKLEDVNKIKFKD